METRRPQIVVLAGPNGAGKSTAARDLLQGAFAVPEFVNADAIAAGLSGFQPEGAAITAGRIMLRRLHALAAERLDFAFETTLASRSFAPWLREQCAEGYRVHITFLALASAELAVQRVADRVRRGGHDVPEPTIRRRYEAGLRNFHGIYADVATTWQLIDNEAPGQSHLVAERASDGRTVILDGERWKRLERT